MMRRLGLLASFERFMEVPGSVDAIIAVVVVTGVVLAILIRWAL